MVKRRTRYDIIRCVLEVLRINGAMGITRLSYAVNLPVDRTKRIVEELLEKNFISRIGEYDHPKYIITARGGELLHALETVKNFLEEDGS
ncbi:MAG: hypothetical protein NDF56_07750 [archaeon GB-1845-036]|nr:hypothetical protein [Candidatus Verstraetearchaeota archaeon]MCS7374856.1 hypothetical protein [Candidatus Culexmicrobium thermophilum]HDO20455.1 hypothetical protein [Candidatus Bathyarchaeota archaeon]